MWLDREGELVAQWKEGRVADLKQACNVWRKSAASGAGNCVEVAFTNESVLVRDSKDQLGPVLSFSPAEWTAFLIGARSAEFDLQ